MVIFENSLPLLPSVQSAPPSAHPSSGEAPRVHLPQQAGPAWQGQGQSQGQASFKPINIPSVTVTEYCRTCWGKGQRSEEDKGKDKCIRGHSNFKVRTKMGVTVSAFADVKLKPFSIFKCLKYEIKKI